MKLTHKIVGLAAAAALVAGAGLAAAPAATSATPSKAATGTTLISFKKELAPITAGITPVDPAKKSGNRLTFPVVDVTKNVIGHSGGITIGGVTVSNPKITIDNKAKTASITVDSPLGVIELFTVKHLKTYNKTKTVVRQGDLHLTSNQQIVDTLNTLVGAAVFTADMGLGQIRITVNK